jgi:hypothetical protein
VLAAFAALAPLGCGGQDNITVITTGGFDPPSHDFGEQPVLVPTRRAFRLTSPTTAAITEIRFDPPSDAYALRLGSGEALVGTVVSRALPVSVDVTFVPRAAQAYATRVLVVFGGEAAAALDLGGRGVLVTPASVRASPSAITFAVAELNRELRTPVELTNEGGVAARIAGVTSEARGVEARAGRTDFYVTMPDGSSVDGLTIPSGASVRVEVRARYRAAGDTSDVLVLNLDGVAANRSPRIPVSGAAVVAGTLDCPQPIVDFGAVTRGAARVAEARCRVVGGRWTYDGFRILSGTTGLYSVLDAPTRGTSFTDGATVAVSFQFIANEVAGLYEADGRFEAENGSVRALTLRGEVVAPETPDLDVSASVTWSDDGSDLDLHLTRNGAPPFHPTDDCYFARRDPDWGRPNDIDDDPFHDRDDVDGLGPEVINLRRAREGLYDLYVHAYRPGRAPVQPSTATVRVENRGRELLLRASPPLACGGLWHVARLRTDGLGGVALEIVDALGALTERAECR